MTVLKAIKKGAEFLAAKGVDSPRLQVELLLAHVLGVPRLQLYLQFERELDDTQVQAARELLRRRGQRQPLQHLLGTVSFCGIELESTHAALIPRPETELLAEQAWQWLQACGQPAPAALDFGTGTGCLAIAIALHCSTARVWALDISSATLELAGRNAARAGVSDRVHLREGDGFQALTEDGPVRFDLVVSNPPYIPTAEIEQLEPEVRDHDPRPALDGGADGMDFYRRLAREAGAWLRPGGRLMVELGDGQADPVAREFTSHKWVVEQIRPDYSARPRILNARMD